jgi:hypothetical protein
MHGGLSPGAPKGNKNALKHGRYTAEAVASRREVAALINAMRALAGVTDVGLDVPPNPLAIADEVIE